jgi:hypothetical protein
LYSPNDLARTKVRIIGDPAWIQQGSIFAGVEPASFNFNAFNPDGTINFDSNQVMFEIAWQRPEDYNLSTGLADPYSGGYSGKAVKGRQPVQSNVYQAIKVTSEFRNGKFEQTLEGSLYRFPKPDKSNTINAANAANGVDAKGNSVGIDVRDEAGQLSTLKRNPETGELYDPGTNSRTGSGAQTKSATSAASNGANSPMISPAPPPVAANDSGSSYNGKITTDVSQSAPAAAPNSNGENISWYDYEAPPKLGETGAPQVGTADLGDFYG